MEDPAHLAPLRRPRALLPPLPPAARALDPLAPLSTPLAQLDVPVVHRPLAVYALIGAGKEGNHE